MIFGERFNLIHMPKTGGTWARRVSEKLPPGIVRKIHPRHLPASGLTDAEAKKPTYVFVRNPWDWYVSLYGHWHGNVVNKRHEFVLPYAKLSPYWQGAHDRFGGTFERAMRPFAKGQAPIDPHTGHRFGSMTEKFEGLTARPGLDVRILRYEDGPLEGYLRILRETGPAQLTPQVERILRTHQKENVSQRSRRLGDYYTPELENLVARLDDGIIRRFGYRYVAG